MSLKRGLSLATISALTLASIVSFPAVPASSIVQRVGELARLGCTPQEQSRPREFPWCANLHTRGIRSVAFSPDGQFIASGSVDKTIKIWSVNDTARGQRNRSLERSLPASPEQVLSVAFSPDGRYLASGGGRLVRLWDWRRGELLKDFTGHVGIVYVVAFSPDGRYLASAGNDKIIRLWDVNSRTLVAQLEDTQEVVSLAFSPDGRTLASGGSGSSNAGSTVKLWDVEDIQDAELAKALGPYNNPIWTLAFSPDGRHLAYSAKRPDFRNEPDNTVRLWNLEGRPIQTLQAQGAEIRSIAFSPDGRFLISSGLNNTIKLWDLEAGQLAAMQAQHLNEIWTVAFSRDGQTFASGSADNTIKVWRLTESTAAR